MSVNNAFRARTRRAPVLTCSGGVGPARADRGGEDSQQQEAPGGRHPNSGAEADCRSRPAAPQAADHRHLRHRAAGGTGKPQTGRNYPLCLTYGTAPLLSTYANAVQPRPFAHAFRVSPLHSHDLMCRTFNDSRSMNSDYLGIENFAPSYWRIQKFTRDDATACRRGTII